MQLLANSKHPKVRLQILTPHHASTIFFPLQLSIKLLLMGIYFSYVSQMKVHNQINIHNI